MSIYKKIVIVGLIVLYSFALNAQGEKNTALGIPKAKTKLKAKNEFIINREQYTLSYNSMLNSANWASWYASNDSYGKVKRYKGKFISDTTLPISFTTVTHSDYTNSGYDRGHIVRSKERSKTIEDNKSTFILSNIIPQTPDLNRGIWLKLEKYCKKLCFSNNKQLFIIAGGKYSKKPDKINNKIAIPDSCWKVILILDKDNDINNIDTSAQIIAVMQPNINGIRDDDWQKYITTARKIERSTGYNFFSKIDDKVQDIIEKRKYYIE